MRTSLPLLCWLAIAGFVNAAPPTDNPVASHYNDDRGYPAWTDRVRWAHVIDMKAYTKGRTNFEKFENARDELAAKGGGVLYYPAGTYDFSEGPFDGPSGRGLMLPSGVVIRGQVPKGKADASAGRLELPTKLVFGFKRRANGIDVGRRLTLVLDGGDIRVHRARRNQPQRYEPAELILSLAVAEGKIGSEVKAFRRGYGRDVWIGKAKVSQSGNAIKLAVELSITDKDNAGTASYDLALTRSGEEVTGRFTGTCRGQATKGKVTGRELTIRPETPRDWNVISLAPPPGGSVKDVNTVGVAWVHVVGGVIWFGPDLEWGSDWGSANR